MMLHPRTLRKAREQVNCLMTDGFSARYIKNYLIRWTRWWCGASTLWQQQKVLQQFFEACWDIQISAVAMTLMSAKITSERKRIAVLDLGGL